MSLIKENYDLSNGPVFTDEVLNPDLWRVSGYPSGCPITQVVTLELWITDDQGNYGRLTDNNDVPIVRKIYGNTMNSTNPIVCNSPKGKVKIVPPTDGHGNYIGKGLISVDSFNN